MYFSFRGERKVPKESPLKESTQVLSLRILSPVWRALFAGGQKGFMRCHFTGRRRSATSAERRACGYGLFAGMHSEFPRPSPRFGRVPCGRRSAVRAGYRASSTFRAFRLLRPDQGEGVARTGGGFRKGGTTGPPLRGALLVLFSRQGEKSTRINLPDKLQFEVTQ